MELMILVGVTGAIALQGSSLFQIVKFIRSKETAGVSIGFWWVVLFGLCCYLLYSIHIKDLLYFCSNAVGITFTSYSIFLYYYYRRKAVQNV